MRYSPDPGTSTARHRPGLVLVALALLVVLAAASEVDDATAARGLSLVPLSFKTVIDQEVLAAGAWRSIAKSNLKESTKRTAKDGDTEKAVAKLNADAAEGMATLAAAATENEETLRDKDAAAEEAVATKEGAGEEAVAKKATDDQKELSDTENAAVKEIQDAVVALETQSTSAQDAIAADETAAEEAFTSAGADFAAKMDEAETAAETQLTEAAQAAAAARSDLEAATIAELQEATAKSAEDRGRLEVSAQRSTQKYEAQEGEEQVRLDGQFGQLAIVRERLATDATETQREAQELAESVASVHADTAAARQQIADLVKSQRLLRGAKSNEALRAAASLRAKRRSHLVAALTENQRLAREKAADWKRLRAAAVVAHTTQIRNAMLTRSELKAEDTRAHIARRQLAHLNGASVVADAVVARRHQQLIGAQAEQQRREIMERAANQEVALAGRTHTRLVNSLKTANRELADLARYENEHTRDVAKAALHHTRAAIAASQQLVGARTHTAFANEQARLAYVKRQAFEALRAQTAQALDQRQRAGLAEQARVDAIYQRDVAQATALARAQARERMHQAGVL